MSGTKVYNVRQARARLPQMIDEVMRGEKVILRRMTDGAEIELLPRSRKREPGKYKGQITFSEDAFASMSEEELAAWENDR